MNSFESCGYWPALNVASTDVLVHQVGLVPRRHAWRLRFLREGGKDISLPVKKLELSRALATVERLLPESERRAMAWLLETCQRIRRP